MTEYQTCYIFAPEQADFSGPISQRPGKRRKTSQAVNSSVQNEPLHFVPLLSGTENSVSVQTRFGLFVRAWSKQEEPLHDLLQSSNIDAVNGVTSFIQAVDLAKIEGKIPAGFIVAGPRTATDAGLFCSIIEHAKQSEGVAAVTIDSAQTPNLKSALKYINKYATVQGFDQKDEESIENSQDNNGRLNYDLQILHNYVQVHSISKVILSFQDSEAFDGSLLMELIDVLSSWNDRIPFVLLFGIATSIDMFQEKISRATTRRLQAVRFDVIQLETEDIFKAATSLVNPGSPLLGPNLSNTILQRQKDYIQSISTFLHAVKYVHMSHFFANPLSIFLDLQVPQSVLQNEHYEAVRNLPSFQRLVEELIGAGEYKSAQDLLNDDTVLYKTLQTKVRESQRSLSEIIHALEVISALRSCLFSKSRTPWSELYISGMSGKLQNSSLTREALLSIRKLPSDAMKDMLIKLSPFSIPGLSAILHDLETLVTDLSQILRSSHDIRNQTLRTTVVAQKVELSAHPSALSRQDREYSSLVTRANDLLHEFFQTSLINPTDLFPHEILIYDLKSPHRDVFAPNSRSAVERALSGPHDYLGCECCDGLESALSATQPPTAVLYQLYLESGALVNVVDLWAAFFAIMGKDDCEDEDQEQQKVLTLFSRALAELKYMGMIKNSRKKADHVAKLLWKGL